jgi:hypothetical protein
MLRWAVNAGRYEGAKAEKAVPFPGVAAHDLLLRHNPAESQHPLRRVDQVLRYLGGADFGVV